MVSPRQTNRIKQSPETLPVKKGVVYLEYEITTPLGPRIISADKEAERITGYSAEAMRGQPFGMIYDPDSLDAFVSLLHSRVCEAKDFCWADKFLVKKGGDKQLHRWTFAPVRGGQGGVHGFAVSIEPLKHSENETVSSAAENQVSKAELASGLDDSRSESLALVAAGIAHDFKNILQPIMSTLEMARMTAQNGSKTQALISDAELALQDAVALAKKMLAFTRGYESEPQTIQINEMLDHVSHISTMGTDVECQLSVSHDLLPVVADPGQIYQVFQNIIINACQAMPNGGIIQVSAENTEIRRRELGLNPGAYVAIRIRDRGCGIPVENLEKIFAPNFTTKADGSGVGLASCQAIVTNHGGKIIVDSTPRVGTEFVVLLPSSKAGGETTRAPARNTTANRVTSPTQPCLESSSRLSDKGGCFPEVTSSPTVSGKVLIVDDQARVLKTAEKLLQFLGYETVSATSGEAALAIYREHMNSISPVDAVLLDMTLPGGLSGDEVKREIKKIDNDARIIATSGYFEDDHAVGSFIQEGWSGVLPKPYAIDALAKTVSNAILSN